MSTQRHPTKPPAPAGTGAAPAGRTAPQASAAAPRTADAGRLDRRERLESRLAQGLSSEPGPSGPLPRRGGGQ